MHQLRLLVFFLFTAAVSVAQVPFAREFWLNESNIPVRVNDLAYAGSGYIWLATDHGLYRFNGRNFVRTPDSLQQPVTAVTEEAGTVYAGYKDGTIGIVRNNAVHPLKIRNRAPSSAVTSLHARGAMLYISTEDEGMFLIMNQTGMQLTAQDGLTDNFIYDVMIAPDEVMVATDRGINHIRWNGKKPVVEVFTTAQGLPDNIVRVLKPIPQSRLCWVGTQEGGLALYDDADETFRQLKMTTPWAWGQINDILPLNNREAWVVTEEGYLLNVMLSHDSLEVQPYTYDGLKLLKLVRDKTGNIWCATNRGLLMNTALYASSLPLGSPYDLRNVTAIACDRNNDLWFTQNDALYRMSLNRPSSPQYVLRTDASITCLHADAGNDLWIGTFGQGMFYYGNGRLTPVKNIAPLAGGHILSIASIGNHLWIASLNGVEEAVMDSSFPGRLTLVKHHNKMAGTGSDYVYLLYPDREGRLWMATDGAGVCMYDGHKYHRWGPAEGFTSQVVYSITEDALGNIWAGTLEKGLFLLKGNKWVQFTKDDGLQDLNIYALRGTSTGELVVVSEDGIDEWYPNSSQFRHFNKRLGVDIDSTLTIPNCITSDRRGKVYIPFEHGFIVFKGLEQQYDIRPAVHINSISLFFKPLETEKREFRHNENHISFRFDGINFSNPERLRYRYKLEHYDTNWIYTNDEVVPFVQLRPGKYTFRVQASLNDSFSDVAEDSYAFTVVRPYWQQVWFLTLVALLVLAAGYAFVKIRERNIRHLSRLQRERMAFEYEHLKSQVNPHFLFNSLNTLVSLIEDDKHAAVDYTVHLSDLYRNMLSYKGQDLIMLGEEYEIIRNYMHIQKSRFGDALQLRTEIPEHLLKTRKIIPLALQLLVENAIKHNVVSRARPLTIVVAATEEEISVRNPIQPKASREKGAGLGLVNIRKRYSLLTSRNTSFGVKGNEYIVTLPLL